jgi:hypothetical protein
MGYGRNFYFLDWPIGFRCIVVHRHSVRCHLAANAVDHLRGVLAVCRGVGDFPARDAGPAVAGYVAGRGGGLVLLLIIAKFVFQFHFRGQQQHVLVMSNFADIF